MKPCDEVGCNKTVPGGVRYCRDHKYPRRDICQSCGQEYEQRNHNQVRCKACADLNKCKHRGFTSPVDARSICDRCLFRLVCEEANATLVWNEKSHIFEPAPLVCMPGHPQRKEWKVLRLDKPFAGGNGR